MKKTSLSVVCVFLVSVMAALAVNRYQIELFVQPVFRAVTLIFYMWIPGVFALIFAGIEKISLPIFQKPSRDLFTAPLWGMAICALSLLFSIPFASALQPSPLFATYSTLKGLGLLSGLIIASYLAALTTNMVSALGEELYWRGYLLEKLKGWGVYRSMGIIGALWGVWHIPLILLMGHHYPNRPFFGSGIMILLCLAMTPLLTFYRFKGRSLLVPSALHGTFNSVAGFSHLFFFAPNPLVVGISGVTGIFALLVVSIGLNLFSKKTWEKSLV